MLGTPTLIKIVYTAPLHYFYLAPLIIIYIISVSYFHIMVTVKGWVTERGQLQIFLILWLLSYIVGLAFT